MTLLEVVLVVEPSPKSQCLFVIVPVERSLKATIKTGTPLVGLAVNATTGSAAPVPVSWLAASPRLLVKIATFVNAPALVGAKFSNTFVEPNAGKLNGTPANTVN